MRPSTCLPYSCTTQGRACIHREWRFSLSALLVLWSRSGRSRYPVSLLPRLCWSARRLPAAVRRLVSHRSVGNQQCQRVKPTAACSSVTTSLYLPHRRVPSTYRLSLCLSLFLCSCCCLRAAVCVGSNVVFFLILARISVVLPRDGSGVHAAHSRHQLLHRKPARRDIVVPAAHVDSQRQHTRQSHHTQPAHTTTSCKDRCTDLYRVMVVGVCVRGCVCLCVRGTSVAE